MTDATKQTLAVWAKGAMSAFISAAAGAVLAAGIDPDHFGVTNAKHMALMACISGIVGLCGYLTKDPFPD